MSKQLRKKLTAWLCCVAMLISMVPGTALPAFATEGGSANSVYDVVGDTSIDVVTPDEIEGEEVEPDAGEEASEPVEEESSPVEEESEPAGEESAPVEEEAESDEGERVAMFATGTSGRAVVDSGHCGGEGDGTNLTWTLYADGELVISGTGFMADYRDVITPWHDVRDSITSLVIEDDVTTIGDNAFLECNLISVEIGDSVTTIGDNAFYYCSSLTSVEIGNSVTIIGDNAFTCCGLTSVVIPNSVTTIDDYAFSDCAGLTSVEIGNGVTTIGVFAFQNCYNLTSVEIPNSVTAIGGWAFYGCDSLSSVEIPDSVITIGDYVFDECDNLYAITVGEGNSNYCDVDGVLFSRDMNTLIQYPCGKTGAYSVPDSVTNVCSWAFSRCPSLTSVMIPNSVTTIGNYTFAYCDNLTWVEFMGDVPAAAGDDIFLGSDNVTVYYHEGTTGWTEGDLYDAEAGTWCGRPLVMIPAEEPEREVIDSGFCGAQWDWGYIDRTNLKWILYSDGELVVIGTGEMMEREFWEDLPWYDFRSEIKKVTIGDGVTSIGQEAFSDCENVMSVYIPGSVTRIGNGAFCYCNSLTEVIISNGVITIGDEAFMSCDGLTSITIPDSVTTIGDDAFRYSDNLAQIKVAENNTAYCDVDGVLFSKDKTRLVRYPGGRTGSYTIPDGVTTIGDGAVAYCPNLTMVTIPDSVIIIGNEAFMSCDGLTSITIPDSVTTIGNGAFDDCDGLPSITIPDSVTTIGDNAFYYCSSLTSVEIGNSVTNIGAGAFSLCDNLTAITVGEDNGAYCDVDGVVFSKDKTLLVQCPSGRTGSYTIPDGVTTIFDYAFYGCDSLTEVIIPNGVITIGDYAFRYCNGLTSIMIPDSVTTIEDDAFWNCISLIHVEFLGDAPTCNSAAFGGCHTDLTIYYHEGTTGWTEGDLYDAEAGTWCGRPLVMIPAGPEGEPLPTSGTLAAGEYVLYEDMTLDGVLTVSSGDVTVDLNGNTLTGIAAGAFVVSGGKLTITGGAVKGVASNATGALVEVTGGEFVLERATLSDHKTKSTARLPGGIYATGGTVTINDSGVTCTNGASSTLLKRTGHSLYAENATVNVNDATINGGDYHVVLGANGKLNVTGAAVLDTVRKTTASGASGMTAAIANLASGASIKISDITPTMDDSVKLEGGVYVYQAPAAKYGIYTIGDTTNGSFTVTVDGREVTEASEGKTVVVQLMPAAGYVPSTILVNGEMIFVNNFTMPAEDVTVEVSFVEDPTEYLVSVGAVSGGTVAVSPTSGTYGTTVTVTATPADGYELKQILVDGRAIVGNTFTISGNHMVTAEFYDLNAKADLPTSGTVAEGEYALNSAAVALTGGLTISGDVTLDLKGNTLAGAAAPYFTVPTGAKLTIMDSKTGGKVQGITATSAMILVSGGEFVLTGGKLTGHINNGNLGGAIYADKAGSKVTINGGEISGNTARRGGAISGPDTASAVDVTIKITGGTVSGNATQRGATMYTQTGATVIIEGGKVGYGTINGEYTDGNSSYEDLWIRNSNMVVTGGDINGVTFNGNAANGYTLAISGDPVIKNLNGVKAEYASIGSLEPGASVTVTGGELTIAENDVTVAVNGRVYTYNYAANAITLNVIGNTMGGASVSMDMAKIGDVVTVTATPYAAEYLVKSITVVGENGEVVPLNDGKFTMPDCSVTVTVEFAPLGEDQSIVKLTQPTEGGIVEIDVVPGEIYPADYPVIISVTPEVGYQISVAVDGELPELSDGWFTFRTEGGKVHDIVATAKKIDYTVTLKYGEGSVGTATLNKTTANYGDEITVAADQGYELVSVAVDNEGTAVTDGKFTMPAADVTVTVVTEVRVIPEYEGLNGVTAGTLVEGEYTLADNVALTGSLTISGEVTLDLNGSDLTGAVAPYFIVPAGSKLTIKDSVGGGMVQGIEAEIAMIVVNGGEFVLDGGRLTGHMNTSAGATSRGCNWGGAIYAPGAGSVVTVNGGEISGNAAYRGGAISGPDASNPVEVTININGGRISGYAMDPSGNHGSAIYTQNGATVNITGGRIESEGWGNDYTTSMWLRRTTTNISGGTIDFMLYASDKRYPLTITGAPVISELDVVAYVFSDIADVTATIGCLLPGARVNTAVSDILTVLDDTVTVGADGRIYAYADGRDYLPSSGVLRAGKYVLSGDLVLNGTLRAESDVTLDLAGHTICMANVDATYFNVPAESKLTIMDSVGGGTIQFNHTPGGCPGFNVYGELVLNGGTLTGWSRDGAGGVVYLQPNATFTMNGGEIVGNRANSAAAIRGNGENITFIMTGGEITANDSMVEDKPVIQISSPGGYVNISGGLIRGNTNVGGDFAPGTEEMVCYDGVLTITGGHLGRICIDYNDGQKAQIWISGAPVIESIRATDQWAVNCAIGVLQSGAYIATTNDFHGFDARSYSYGNVLVTEYDNRSETGESAACGVIYTAKGNIITTADFHDGLFTLDRDMETGVGFAVGDGDFTLDLAGHTLKESYVTVPEGVTLTITDSSTAKTGGIKGTSTRGAMIKIDRGGKLVLEGGTLYGHTNTTPTWELLEKEYSLQGGAICNRGTFVMTGGSISGNEVLSKEGLGGAVYAASGSETTITGGYISGNCAWRGGAISTESLNLHYSTNATITIGGDAKFVGNIAKNRAAQIYAQLGTVLTIAGGAVDRGYVLEADTQVWNFAESYESVWLRSGDVEISGGEIDSMYYISQQPGYQLTITGNPVIGGLYRADGEWTKVKDLTEGANIVWYQEFINDTDEKTNALACDETVRATASDRGDLKTVVYTYADVAGRHTITKVPAENGSFIVAEEGYVQVVDPISIVNDDAVPFELRNGTYYSANYAHNSTSELEIVAQENCTLKLWYGVSSEQGYDILYVLHNGNQLVAISGETEDGMELAVAAGDRVVIRYSKDYSMSNGQDCGWVTIDYAGVEAVDEKTSAYEGETLVVVATPDAGYRVDTILVNGEAIQGDAFTMPDEDVTVEVNFVVDTTEYAVTVEQPAEGGTISVYPSAGVSGTAVTVTATAEESYVLDKIFVDGKAIRGNSFIITGEHVVTAAFKKITCTVEFSEGPYDMAIYPNGSGVYEYGEEITVEVGYMYDEYNFYAIVVDGVYYYDRTVTFTATGNHRVWVEYEYVPTPRPLYYITVLNECAGMPEDDWDDDLEWFSLSRSTGDEGGDYVYVEPTSGYVDDMVTVYAAALPGYRIAEILVDGTPIYGNTFYIEHDHEVFVVFEQDIYCGGEGDGSNLTWTLHEDGKLVISGTGAMADYRNGTAAPWYDVRDRITSLVIEDGVTTIGGEAFYNCNSLTSVVIPDSVTIIGGEAFYNCNSLTSVVIPDSVTTIGDYAFQSCDSLTSVVIPDSVTTIGSYAFAYCYSLTLVEIGNGVTTIGAYAFTECGALTTVEISNGVIEIGGGAFYGCNSLTSVTIPASVAFIGENALAGCADNLVVYCYADSCAEIYANENGITVVVLDEPNRYSITKADAENGSFIVTSDKNAPFTSVNTSVVPWTVESNTYYSNNHENESSSEIKFYVRRACTVEMNYGVSSEQNYDKLYVLHNGNWLVVISGEVEDSMELDLVAGDTIVVRYTKDVSVYHGDDRGWVSFDFGYDMPEAVEAAEGETIVVTATPDAGYRVDTILVNGEVIQGNTFTMPDEAVVVEVIFAVPEREVIDSGYCGGEGDGTNLTWILYEDGELVISGTGAMADYTTGTATPWYDVRDRITSLVIEDGVVTIGDRAFYDCDDLTSVEIPDSVTTIGAYAFAWGNNLASVVIPDSVTTIGAYAFAWGNNLASVVIPDSVTTIGAYAFYDCNALTSAEIPDSVTTIGERAFGGCDGLTAITVGEGNSSYCDVDGVLFSKDMTTLIQYPGGKSGAYTIPDGVVTIGAYAFYRCDSLTSVVIPDSVTSIGGEAFYNCNSLTSVVIPDSVTTIGDCAFQSCNSLNSVVIPNSVTTIGGEAFYNCNSLTSVVIPDSVTIIGYGAFFYCGNLTRVEFMGDAPTDVGDDIFWDSYNVTVYYHEGTAGWPTNGTWQGRPLVMIAGEPEREVIDSGYCGGEGDGTNLTWTLYEDGELVISGSGAMADYGRGSMPWYDVRDRITSLVIEDGVTTIGENAFYDCDDLTSVEIPDSVTTIGDSAFISCNALTSVVIPDSVTTIGSNAFALCYSLTSVVIPDSVTIIGYGAFQSCNSLTAITVGEGNGNYCDVDGVFFSKDMTTLIRYPGGRSGAYTIPDGVTTIGDDAFSGCYSLTSVVIPDSVTTIGSFAFQSCNSLTSVVIPDSVTTIGDYAFQSCNSLTSVVIPDSVTSIGAYAFAGCYGLTSVVIPNSVATICYEAFYDCDALTSVVIPDGVITIDNRAFVGCDGLSSVVIGDSVTTVGDEAFSHCENLAFLEIGDSVTTIGAYAFVDCDALTSVEIPGSVTTIGAYAFGRCDVLTRVEFTGDAPADVGDDSFLGSDNVTVYYHEGTAGWPTNGTWCGRPLVMIAGEPEREVIDSGYCGGEGDGTNLTWTLYEDGELVVSGSGAMEDYDADYNPAPWYDVRDRITSLVIEDGVTTIGDCAFTYCYSLTSVVIPNSVTTIGRYAFAYCYSLTSVEIPDSVTTIGYCAFSDCDALTSVVIPDSVTTIGDCVFGLCNILTAITVGEGNGNYCDVDGVLFSKDMTTLIQYPGGRSGAYTIPDGVTTIGSYAFAFCYSLTFVVIPDSVTSIGDYAFVDCDALTSVVLPDSVTSIGDCAFQSCNSLTSVVIPNSVTTIGSYAFAYCYSLTSLVIPDSVTTIGDYAFNSCYGLTAITVGEGNGNYCDVDGVLFSKDMTTLIQYPGGRSGAYTIPDGVTTIGSCAFQSCYSLTSVVIPDSVVTIGAYAFSDCDALTSAVLPDNVTTIGGVAFASCDALTRVEFMGDAPTDVGDDIFWGSDNVTVYYHEGTTGWPTDGTWQGRPLVMIAEELPAYANLNGVTSGTLPEGKYTLTENVALTGGLTVSGEVILDLNGWTLSGVEMPYFTIAAGAKLTIMDSVGGGKVQGISEGADGSMVVISGGEFVLESGTLTGNYCTKNRPGAIYASGGTVTINGGAITGNATRASYASAYGHSVYVKNATINVNGGIVGDGKNHVKMAGGSVMNVTGNPVVNAVNATSSNSIFLTELAEGVSVKVSGAPEVTMDDSAKVATVDGTSEYTYVPWIVESGICGGEGDGSNLTWTLYRNGELVIEGTGEMRSYNYDGGVCDGSLVKAIRIESGVTSIGDYAFSGFAGVETIELSDSVTYIGEGAFMCCEAVTEIRFGQFVEGIGGLAFFGCESIECIELPDSVAFIGERAFACCSAMTMLMLSDGLEYIGAQAFGGCDSLEELIVPEGVLEIGEDTFSDCTALTRVEFLGDVPECYGDLFRGSDAVIVYYHSGTNGWPEDETWQGRPLVKISTEILVVKEQFDPDGAMLDGDEFIAVYEVVSKIEQGTVLNSESKIVIYKNGVAVSEIDGEWGTGYAACGPYNPQMTVVGSRLVMTFNADGGTLGSGAVFLTTSTDGVTWTKAVKVADTPMAYGLTALSNGNLLLSVADTSTKVLTLTTAGAVTGSVELDESVADVAIAEADANVYAVTSNGAIYVSTDKGATWNATAVTGGEAMGSPDMVVMHKKCIYVTWSDEANRNIFSKVWTIDLNDETGCYGWNNSEVELVVEGYELPVAYNGKASAGQPASIKSGSDIKTVYVDGGELQSVTKSVVTKMATSVSLESSMVITFKVPQADIDALGGAYAKVIRMPADGSAAVETIMTVSEAPVNNSGLYEFPYSGISAKQMGDDVIFAVYNDKDEQITMMGKQSVKAYAMSQLATTTKTTLRTLLVDMLNYGAAAQTRFSYAVDKLANSDLTETQKAWASADLVLDDTLTNVGSVNATKQSGKSLTLENVIEVNVKYKTADVPGASYAKISYTTHAGTAYTGTVELVDDVSNGTPVKVVSITTLAPADVYTPVSIELYDDNDQPIEGTAQTYTMATYAYSVVKKDPELTSANAIVVMRMVQFGLSARKHISGY